MSNAGCGALPIEGRGRSVRSWFCRLPVVCGRALARAGKPIEQAGGAEGDAQDDLRDTRARLRAILDHVPVSISLKDRQHRYVVLNKQYETWFGVTQAQQLGRTLAAVGTDAEFTALMERIEDRVLATGAVESWEVREPDIRTASAPSTSMSPSAAPPNRRSRRRRTPPSGPIGPNRNSWPA